MGLVRVLGRVEAVDLPWFVLALAEQLHTVPRSATVAELEQICAGTGFSRFPVREDDGTLVGYVHTKDLLGIPAERRHDPTTVEGQVFGGLQRLVRTRQALPQLHAQTSTEALSLGNDAVFALLRTGPRGHVLALANLTASPQHVSLHGFDRFGPLSGLRDAITGDDLWWELTLEPYQQRWVTPTP